MKIKNIITTIVLLFLVIPKPVYAVLNLELTKGVDQALPIAVMPFKFQGSEQPPLDMADIITQDLQNSGRFKLFDAKNLGIDNVVIGNIQPQSNAKYKITFSLKDVRSLSNSVLINKTYVAKETDLRRLAHKIADIIYQKLTGERGIFSTKIAYVVVRRQRGQPAKYSLVIADADGYNARAILTSNQPIMSPAWSPDGRSIAYVSFENRRSALFVSDVVTGKRRLISKFPGINGAPAWSPDGKHLAVVLSRGNSTKIFLVDLHNGKLSQLTNGWLIDTEPSFTPDGQSMLFTSDRAGTPQIYLKNLDNNTLKRLTFVGKYNARASFTPDGKNIVMLHHDQGSFNIAIQNLKTNVVTMLVGACDNQSPSVAPNGRMVIYATHDADNHGVLALVSTDGKVRLTLPETNGEVREPAWSPF